MQWISQSRSQVSVAECWTEFRQLGGSTVVSSQSRTLTGPSLIRNRAGYRVIDALEDQVEIESPVEGKREKRIGEESWFIRASDGQAPVEHDTDCFLCPSCLGSTNRKYSDSMCLPGTVPFL